MADMRIIVAWKSLKQKMKNKLVRIPIFSRIAGCFLPFHAFPGIPVDGLDILSRYDDHEYKRMC